MEFAVANGCGAMDVSLPVEIVPDAGCDAALQATTARPGSDAEAPAAPVQFPSDPAPGAAPANREEAGGGEAAAQPAALEVLPGAAPAPVPPQQRAKRASALQAFAKVTSWNEEEAASFTAVAGRDIFITAKSKAAASKAGRDRRAKPPPAPAPVPPPRGRGKPTSSKNPMALRQRAAAQAAAGISEDEVDFSSFEYDSDEAPQRTKRRPGAVPEGAAASKRLRISRSHAAKSGKQSAEDQLFGCGKCRYLKAGCGVCRSKPAFTRPKLRWHPEAGRPQLEALPAPSFRPTPEEFQDPVAYISKIMPEAEKFGLAHIIPPEGWEPPFALERGTNGLGMESFRFQIRKQLTSHLCCRRAPERPAGGAAPVAGGPVPGRYSGRKFTQQAPTAPADSSSDGNESSQHAEAGLAGPHGLTAADVAGALAAVNGGDPAAAATAAERELREPMQEEEQQGEEEEEEEEEDSLPPEFGFASLEKRHTLRSFAAYADWVKSVHFSEPVPSGQGVSTAPGKRPKSLPTVHQPPREPSVEEVEAEFWRIVEAPDGPVESLYGQDLDSGHHGSGFPLPEWRRRLLEAHLASKQRASSAAGAAGGAAAQPPQLPPYGSPAEATYAAHPWNINNMPRCKQSVLRYLLGDGLITGVMVPWLYVGSCLSAFCWHVEDHALYSVNYLHMGAPKVWYGIPAAATQALEEAMRDALPHLFEASPNLLYQLVTMVSPAELKRRGVPVHRVVHEAGTFVVTMPNAYHAGFNTGFNCAEAVNFAAPDWLPYGTDVAAKYRATHKAVTMSHDSLLVALVTAAQHVQLPKERQHATGTAAADAAAAAGNEAGNSAPQDEAEQGGNVGHSAREAGAEHGGKAGNSSSEAEAGAEQGINGNKEAAPPTGTDAEEAEEKEGASRGFGPLGDIPWQDAPVAGIRLAAGELALRAEEERERWAAGLAAAGLPSLPQRAVDGAAPAGAHDADGVLINTADCDCAECKGDLWLAAVVSPAAPCVAVCIEHAGALVHKHGCPPDSLVAVVRHTPEELTALVELARERVGGVEAAVQAARARRARNEAERVRAVPAGPLYDPDEDEDSQPAAQDAAEGALLDKTPMGRPRKGAAKAKQRAARRAAKAAKAAAAAAERKREQASHAALAMEAAPETEAEGQGEARAAHQGLVDEPEPAAPQPDAMQVDSPGADPEPAAAASVAIAAAV